jgi:predicted GNAT superfamily acetyltransferase
MIDISNIGSSNTGFEVRRLATPGEMHLIEDLQREIWGYGEPGADTAYPARALFALSESGGLVSLALLDGEPAGFAVAWLGRSTDFYLHSQLVGVRPAFRRRGVALVLKLHQRNFALEQGLSLVRWTFDPLRAANARLNLHRLGAFCRSFHPAYYGRLSSRFESGIDSDRLWAEWPVASERVRRRLEGEEDPPDLETRSDVVQCGDAFAHGERFRRPLEWRAPADRRRLRLEIPFQFDRIRQVDPEAAADWRRTSREALRRCLGDGYVLHDLWFGEDDAPRAYYLLDRPWSMK